MVTGETTIEISILINNKEVIGRGRITEDVIHDLDVDLKYRGQGVATEIVRKLIGLGGRQLFVHVKNMPAIRLYQKCGFEIVDEADGFYKMRLMGGE